MTVPGIAPLIVPKDPQSRGPHVGGGGLVRGDDHPHEHVYKNPRHNHGGYISPNNVIRRTRCFVFGNTA